LPKRWGLKSQIIFQDELNRELASYFKENGPGILYRLYFRPKKKRKGQADLEG